MKKYAVIIFWAGVIFASCQPNSSSNKSKNYDDSIRAIRLRDSLLDVSKKVHIQDSIDALKDTGKKQ